MTHVQPKLVTPNLRTPMSAVAHAATMFLDVRTTGPSNASAQHQPAPTAPLPTPACNASTPTNEPSGPFPPEYPATHP